MGGCGPPEDEHEAKMVSGCPEGRLSVHRQQGKSKGDQFSKGKSPRLGPHPRGGLAVHSLQALMLPSPLSCSDKRPLYAFQGDVHINGGKGEKAPWFKGGSPST